ncbi:hypothetical protein KQX54_017255 [Cotesia glomerata]|uniref:Uncharacterized protein n=1 Tax=Cotesia glomerata TaxID=32391 RepID=A0AAV7IXG6_COTGL|nr:hypothetical protein KQX54_017255 [Cotesia glomerata]
MTCSQTINQHIQDSKRISINVYSPLGSKLSGRWHRSVKENPSAPEPSDISFGRDAAFVYFSLTISRSIYYHHTDMQNQQSSVAS